MVKPRTGHKHGIRLERHGGRISSMERGVRKASAAGAVLLDGGGRKPTAFRMTSASDFIVTELVAKRRSFIPARARPGIARLGSAGLGARSPRQRPFGRPTHPEGSETQKLGRDVKRHAPLKGSVNRKGQAPALTPTSFRTAPTSAPKPSRLARADEHGCPEGTIRDRPGRLRSPRPSPHRRTLS